MLDEAEGAGERLGGDYNHRWTAFGPANVQLHRVNIATFLGDAGQAIAEARRIDLNRIPITERKAALASEVGRLVGPAQQRGWDVRIIATPAALEFIDASNLAAQTGRPIRSEYREPGEPRSPRADAIIVAPATTTPSTSGQPASATLTPLGYSQKHQDSEYPPLSSPS